MVLPASTANDLTLNITQEIRVNAQLDATFAALLEQIGPHNEFEDGKPMPMKLEARPGGRWYRDLGNDNGHLWGHVQAIKRPTLLEISGPLFMSFAAVSNLQYRLTPVDGGTLITFKHSALGLIPDEHRTGVQTGWAHMLEGIRRAAEKGDKKRS
ncbi:MAG TPA: SRPBCC domain-containing protein [Candidatus Limnocylindrales bacterium]|nr:SRPBCC domain-containing protein [Candidatus Limnocylindrales bacterium]